MSDVRWRCARRPIPRVRYPPGHRLPARQLPGKVRGERRDAARRDGRLRSNCALPGPTPPTSREQRMAAPTIATGLKQLLARYMPFSSMTPEHLNFVVEHVEVAYFEPGETILGPSSEPPSHCYIVKQGRVQGETTNEKQGEVAFEAGVGDCFPVGALLAGPPRVARLPLGDGHLLPDAAARALRAAGADERAVPRLLQAPPWRAAGSVAPAAAGDVRVGGERRAHHEHGAARPRADAQATDLRARHSAARGVRAHAPVARRFDHRRGERRGGRRPARRHPDAHRPDRARDPPRDPADRAGQHGDDARGDVARRRRHRRGRDAADGGALDPPHPGDAARGRPPRRCSAWSRNATCSRCTG